eukprot:2823754-Rhodomonas_salina.1
MGAAALRNCFPGSDMPDVSTGHRIDRRENMTFVSMVRTLLLFATGKNHVSPGHHAAHAQADITSE